MTPKEVQKKLNILFPEVGDAWMRNYDKSETTFGNISFALLCGFAWNSSPEGFCFWCELDGFISELERAEVI